MKALAIFDLDGTLINSIEDLADSMNAALSDNGLAVHNVSDYYRFVGDGAAKLIVRAIGANNYTDELVVKVKSDFVRHYSENVVNKTFVYDGAIELLMSLKKKGYMLAVASNKPDEFISYIVTNLFADKTFDYIRGNISGTPHKPDPQIVFDIINKLNVEKDNCCFVGDSGVDILTAKNAGIKSIGCLWGYRNREELEGAGADYIVGHPLDILEIL